MQNISKIAVGFSLLLIAMTVPSGTGHPASGAILNSCRTIADAGEPETTCGFVCLVGTRLMVHGESGGSAFIASATCDTLTVQCAGGNPVRLCHANAMNLAPFVGIGTCRIQLIGLVGASAECFTYVV
jgi:hypothetical protein